MTAVNVKKLKEQVCAANLELVAHKLVVFTWGNVSQIDRSSGLVAIKPSGVSYEALSPDDIVVLDLNGRIVEGSLRPSSDTPTHLELYRQFTGIGGITHTHSRYATMWAQACKDLPCFGTTHADHFYGAVPVTEVMSDPQIQSDYELNTGKVIVRRFAGIDPMQMPAVLVANHGPFTWGRDAHESVKNAVVLEECAQMAMGTLTISPQQPVIKQTLLDKHYLRKHGENAYYGQA
jgi:L-ribulose-5-phosphate 4-epimerase